MRLYSILLMIVLHLSLAAVTQAAQVVNDTARMEGGRLLIEYDLKGEAGQEVEVRLTLTMDGKKYTHDDLHLEGDFGKVSVGTSKRIWWNGLQDFPRGFHGRVDWELTARGGPREGMVFIKGGCFEMGNPFKDSYVIVSVLHEVCLDDFYMDRTEVTQSAFEQVMSMNPSRFKGCDDCPVEFVTWEHAKLYCEKVGKRLPTEAEWEYTARSGGKKERYPGTAKMKPRDYAWYAKNSRDKHHPVAKKRPNGLGLYDMSGNVWEWVSDWYAKDYYKRSPRDNPKGPESGQNRVIRGGSWMNGKHDLLTYERESLPPDGRTVTHGFRCAGTP